MSSEALTRKEVERKGVFKGVFSDGSMPSLHVCTDTCFPLYLSLFERWEVEARGWRKGKKGE